MEDRTTVYIPARLAGVLEDLSATAGDPGLEEIRIAWQQRQRRAAPRRGGADLRLSAAGTSELVEYLDRTCLCAAAPAPLRRAAESVLDRLTRPAAARQHRSYDAHSYMAQGRTGPPDGPSRATMLDRLGTASQALRDYPADTSKAGAAARWLPENRAVIARAVRELRALLEDWEAAIAAVEQEREHHGTHPSGARAGVRGHSADSA